MSTAATAWALRTKFGHPVRKIIMWGLADHAHADGTHAWASVGTLAEYADVDERTVRRHLGALMADGWLRESEDQSAVEAIPLRRRPIVYELAMSEGVRAAWASTPHAGRRAVAQAQGGTRRAQPSGWGDNLTPHSDRDVTPHSPVDNPVWGDIGSPCGVTVDLLRGDTAVSPKPKDKPEDKPPPPLAVALMVVVENETRVHGIDAPTLRVECDRLAVLGWTPDTLAQALRSRSWSGAGPGLVIRFLRAVVTPPRLVVIRAPERPPLHVVCDRCGAQYPRHGACARCAVPPPPGLRGRARGQPPVPTHASDG